MATKLTAKPFRCPRAVQHGPEPAHRQADCSNDTASAVSATTYRYEASIRELQARFEIVLVDCRPRHTPPPPVLS